MPRQCDAAGLAARRARAEVEAAKNQSKFWLQSTVEKLTNMPNYRQRVYEYLEGLIAADLVVYEPPTRPQAPPAALWLDQYNSFENTPAKFLKKLCNAIDGITYSDGNLKALCKPNQWMPPARSLCEILEFNTDVPRHYKLPANIRDLDACTKFVINKCKKAGNRGARLSLPAKWPTMGIRCIRPCLQWGWIC